mmetsp:Transcript_6526/g.25244  ORF Transcript_6526/g.25244 Transcript_6526/m.25244 type:complete len:313 (+) Transcript_6526:1498-2436(+)
MQHGLVERVAAEKGLENRVVPLEQLLDARIHENVDRNAALALPSFHLRRQRMLQEGQHLSTHGREESAGLGLGIDAEREPTHFRSHVCEGVQEGHEVHVSGAAAVAPAGAPLDVDALGPGRGRQAVSSTEGDTAGPALLRGLRPVALHAVNQIHFPDADAAIWTEAALLGRFAASLRRPEELVVLRTPTHFPTALAPVALREAEAALHGLREGLRRFGAPAPRRGPPVIFRRIGAPDEINLLEELAEPGKRDAVERMRAPLVRSLPQVLAEVLEDCPADLDERLDVLVVALAAPSALVPPEVDGRPCGGDGA